MKALVLAGGFPQIALINEIRKICYDFAELSEKHSEIVKRIKVIGETARIF